MLVNIFSGLETPRLHKIPDVLLPRKDECIQEGGWCMNMPDPVRRKAYEFQVAEHTFGVL